MVFDRDRGRVVLFGGRSSMGVTLADLWEWDGQAWVDLTPFSTPARRRMAMAYDEVRRNVVVFGGSTSGGGTSNETRTWDGSQWTVIGNGPISARSGAAMAFDAQRGVVVLFGGLFGSAGFQSDTWEWDGAAWSLRATGAGTPPGRHSHAMAYDRARRRVMLFGGLGVGPSPLMDTWEYNGSEWIPGPPAEVPSARAFMSAAYDESAQQTLMFGGRTMTPPDIHFSGTWLWDGTEWASRGTRVVPPHRAYPGVAYDSARGVTVVVGGRGAGGLLNDTWEWNGSNWEQKPALPGERPGVVERAAMCFDSTRNVAIHFGGQNDTLLSGETWEWDGSRWTLASQVGPSPRRAHAMAYDPVRREAVLFGGEDANGRSDETWVWNGTGWSPRHSPQRPAPRVHAAMAFDPTRGQVVLFGGFANGIGYANDAWAWDGSVWTPIDFDDDVPPPRDEHGLVFDSARNRLVLIGGLIADNQPIDDAWELVGDEWNPISDVPPTPRFGAGFVFDELRGQVLMIGGADPERILDQVWTLRSGAPEITRSPSSGRSLVGAARELRVTARSEGSVTYVWRRNASPLTDGGHVSGSRTMTLTLNPAMASDTGLYDVLVTNACGSVRSLVASVEIACPADLDDGSGTGLPDGGVTIEDLLYYLSIFELGTAQADLDDGSATGTPDGGVTIEDLLYFLQRYEGGC